MKVGILMGSTSDESKMQKAKETLEEFGIEYDWRVLSAHRNPEQVVELVESVENKIGPIEVFVFNIGGNVMYSILDTTTRVYTKVWEMCALAGFLTGREVARRMVSRKHGTMLFTGATASVRGSNGFSAFAGGKHALRALAQSMAKELMP